MGRVHSDSKENAIGRLCGTSFWIYTEPRFFSPAAAVETFDKTFFVFFIARRALLVTP